MKNLKVIFMGTPLFSVPILTELINKTNVILVVTTPDAFIGRKKILTACPVKELALKNNIEVFSPSHIRKDYERIKELNPDIIITCAYGQIIPKEVLAIPKFGCINIHASLLPKYRGGAPIHYALINGEDKTGITIMYMDEGMDSGDIIKEEEIKILPDDNIETLGNKLSLLGTKMILEELPKIINNTNQRQKQDESKVSFAPIIKREDEHLDFNKPALEVYNKIRALTPHPLANFIMDNEEYKIGKCEIVKASGNVSTIVNEDKESFTIKCAIDGLKIDEIKRVGKSLMSVKDFKNGYHEDLINKVIK
jgi:methionyl-tRNA formyltransferase